MHPSATFRPHKYRPPLGPIVLLAIMVIPMRCRPWSLTLVRKVIAMIAEDAIGPARSPVFPLQFAEPSVS